MSEKDRTYEAGYADGFIAGFKLAKGYENPPPYRQHYLDKTPDWSHKGCRVCGIGEANEILGYVCNRNDCPTKITSF